jgi:hypothetical protein
MTSATRPRIPAAPCGADDARISLRSTLGLIRVMSCATKLPMENPRTSAWPNSIAARKAMASRAICPMVSGVVPAAVSS